MVESFCIFDVCFASESQNNFTPSDQNIASQNESWSFKQSTTLLKFGPPTKPDKCPQMIHCHQLFLFHP
jgi:hypothetical protein